MEKKSARSWLNKSIVSQIDGSPSCATTRPRPGVLACATVASKTRSQVLYAKNAHGSPSCCRSGISSARRARSRPIWRSTIRSSVCIRKRPLRRSCISGSKCTSCPQEPWRLNISTVIHTRAFYPILMVTPSEVLEPLGRFRIEKTRDCCLSLEPQRSRKVTRRTPVEHALHGADRKRRQAAQLFRHCERLCE